jgi:hypothetical protein
MGRPRKRALFPIALSLSAAADALQCRLTTLQQAVDLGHLAMHQDPTSRRQRVLASELCEYVRQYWPRATRRGVNRH